MTVDDPKSENKMKLADNRLETRTEKMQIKNKVNKQ